MGMPVLWGALLRRYFLASRHLTHFGDAYGEVTVRIPEMIPEAYLPIFQKGVRRDVSAFRRFLWEGHSILHVFGMSLEKYPSMFGNVSGEVFLHICRDISGTISLRNVGRCLERSLSVFQEDVSPLHISEMGPEKSLSVFSEIVHIQLAPCVAGDILFHLLQMFSETSETVHQNVSGNELLQDRCCHTLRMFASLLSLCSLSILAKKLPSRCRVSHEFRMKF
jgi:hypothetical protein